MKFFEKRNSLKVGKDILHHARHLSNMREDLMTPEDKDRLAKAEVNLHVAMKEKDHAKITDCGNKLYDISCSLAPIKKMAGFKENFEVLVVALAVAMAIKAYFLQPFKIPTGSMQPTLNGVTVEEGSYKPTYMDKMPLRYLKWIVTGDKYMNVVAKKDGIFQGWYDTKYSPGNSNPVYMYCVVGPTKYKIPEGAYMKRFESGEFVKKGTVIWEGVMKAGDHVFVDKVSWNFRRPKRGEIMVFKNDNIAGIDRGTHYIKRLVGLPGEKIRIRAPSIEINGEILTEPHQITRIQNQEAPYAAGYQNPGNDITMPYMANAEEVMQIPEDGYIACGDNTRSSRDSRYWGPVPEANMLGPAVLVYWPFTRRWGLANR
jgi:signal peptidase I